MFCDAHPGSPPGAPPPARRAPLPVAPRTGAARHRAPATGGWRGRGAATPRHCDRSSSGGRAVGDAGRHRRRGRGGRARGAAAPRPSGVPIEAQERRPNPSRPRRRPRGHRRAGRCRAESAVMRPTGSRSRRAWSVEVEGGGCVSPPASGAGRSVGQGEAPRTGLEVRRRACRRLWPNRKSTVLSEKPVAGVAARAWRTRRRHVHEVVSRRASISAVDQRGQAHVLGASVPCARM